MLIRGIFGICGCGAELNVREDVVGMASVAQGVIWQTICPTCRTYRELIVTREIQHQAAAYLRQAYEDETQRDEVVVPLNENEHALLEFHNRLDQMTDNELWVALLGN